MATTRSSGPALVHHVIQQTGAERTGHFAIGEYHSRRWISDKLLLAQSVPLMSLCRYLALQVLEICPSPTSVVGLAPDGIALAQAFGAPLAAQVVRQESDRFLSLYAREDMTFPPEYLPLLAETRAVVVQSVVYTGTVTSRLIRAIRNSGGTVEAVATLLTRGRHARQRIEGVPVVALYDYSAEDWPEGACALCAAGVPIDDPHAVSRKA